MASILLLEDDRLLSGGIQLALKKDGHTVFPAYSFSEGIEHLHNTGIQLFLLDINLPDGSGTEFCKRIRMHSENPVIFLTANDTEQDMLDGFRAGCDDFIPKPFSVEVLRQKVLAILRRSKLSGNHILECGALTIDFDKRAALLKGEEIRLTATEYDLLACLVQNRGRVMTRAALLAQVWDFGGDFVDENTLSVNIRRLRKKIEPDPNHPEFIQTVFGIGYTFGK